MDLVTCHCRNTRCAQCGKMGNASALQPHGSDRGEVRLESREMLGIMDQLRYNGVDHSSAT